MHDEATSLMETLTYTLGVIVNSDGDDRQRLIAAYEEAQAFATGIALADGSARPRIIACLQRFKAYKAAEDIAAAAWMLTAIEERIAEHNLVGWPTLKIVSDKAASFLRPPRKQMH